MKRNHRIICGLFFLSGIISCGSPDHAKEHADSIGKGLIKLSVPEKELQELLDSSEYVFKAKLDEAGVPFMWDFGTAEAQHYFHIDTCYKGNDSGMIIVHQLIHYLPGKMPATQMRVSNVYFLFLKSMNYPPPIPPPVIDSSGQTINFDDHVGAKIYELTNDSLGIVPWNADLEIRIRQLSKAKKQ
jgi:hypothetical protein